MSEEKKMEELRLYVGTMNDAIFIIDKPPRPAPVDHTNPNNYANVIAKMTGCDQRALDMANAFVAAWNRRSPPSPSVGRDSCSPQEGLGGLSSTPSDAQLLPCPICHGIEGCDHTAPERKRAVDLALDHARLIVGLEKKSTGHGWWTHGQHLKSALSVHGGDIARALLAASPSPWREMEEDELARAENARTSPATSAADAQLPKHLRAWAEDVESWAITGLPETAYQLGASTSVNLAADLERAAAQLEEANRITSERAVPLGAKGKYRDCTLTNGTPAARDATRAKKAAQKILGWTDTTPGAEGAKIVARAYLALNAAWACNALRQSLPEPADCDWPVCGCDPYADKVITSLRERGLLDHKAEGASSVSPEAQSAVGTTPSPPSEGGGRVEQ